MLRERDTEVEGGKDREKKRKQAKVMTNNCKIVPVHKKVILIKTILELVGERESYRGVNRKGQRKNKKRGS